MVSTAMMGLTELAQFLVASGTYSTVADAIAALNLIVIEDVGVAGTAIAVQGGAAELVIGTVGETALEVAAQAELAATGTNVTTAGIGLLEGAGGNGAVACGLLGVDLGIVAAAAAPILGVSLGAAMYESNPELWTKISQKLLPFCYPDTTVIPTWAEIVNDAWQASVLKDVVDALKDLFEEEGIPVSGGSGASSKATDAQVAYYGQQYNLTFATSSVGTAIASTYYYECEVTSGSAIFASYKYPNGNPAIIPWSKGPFTVKRTIHRSDGSTSTSTFNSSVGGTIPRTGETYYIAYPNLYDSGTMGNNYSPPATEIPSGASTNKIADIILNGTQVAPGEYQEGTSEWEGTTPQEIPESGKAIIDGVGDVKKSLVPISFPYEIPETDPSPETKPDNWPEELPSPKKVGSPNPQVQPDPTEVTDPQKQVQPYIQPLPIPWQITSPDQQTEPDPTLDPTTPRPPTEIITNPPIELGPEPIGLSPWPSMPTTPSSFPLDGSAGLITVYNPTSSELYAFESWLWVTLSQASVQTVWNNPFDGVIGLFELYCTPTINGRRNIHSGFLDSGVAADTVSRYTYIDCGTLGIPEYYGNYLDYSPYSKAHIYLPFIGIQELNVDDIVGHAVNVTYRIDEYNGSCIAMITVAKVTEVNGEEVEYSNTMYQFSGNCAVELPISGGNQSSILAGMMTANAYQQAANISASAQMIGGIASTLGGLLSLNAGGIGSGISQMVGAGATQAYGQAQALSHMLSGKSTVQKSGQFGSSHGALGIKVPFITITRPKQIQVPNYEELYGFPAHKMVTIGACQGFLRCREVHVISSTATDEEKAIIEQMLKSGVYVTE